MKIRRFLMLWIGLVIWASAASAENGLGGAGLFEQSVVTIREKAREAGKPYLVHFTAKWCMPCRWMESATYQDPRVGSYLSEHYLTAKVDIDDFDGFAWKEYYGIKALPTLLVFSSEGRLLEKKENALSPSQMMDVLHSAEARAIPGTTPEEVEARSPDSAEQALPPPAADVAEVTEAIVLDGKGEVPIADRYLQFGLFSSPGNAREHYDRLAKILTLPIEIGQSRTPAGELRYTVRTLPATQDELAHWTRECEDRSIAYLTKDAP